MVKVFFNSPIKGKECKKMGVLLETIQTLQIGQVAMWIIGGVLIYLAIKKDMEPTLLLPMGFGAILVNLPESGAKAVIDRLFEIGVENNELMPLILFIGIGAMIDFEPLLTNPKLMIFGAAAQFGIFFTLSLASLFGYQWPFFFLQVYYRLLFAFIIFEFGQ